MRRARSWLAVAAIVLLGGCSTFPTAPEPLPENYLPSGAAVAPVDSGGLLSPDGFTAAQRMTVRVRNVGCDDFSTGTGFAIDTHTFVTNRHVVENTRKLELTTYDGRTLSVTASAVTTVADLAVVTTEESIGTYSVLAQEDPETGDAISVVGYPGGGTLTTVTGVVVGESADPLGSAVGTVLATTAIVEPGSSGSPVLNERGEVVGVIYAKDAEDQSYMVPVSVLRTLLNQDALLVPEPKSCEDV